MSEDVNPLVARVAAAKQRLDRAQGHLVDCERAHALAVAELDRAIYRACAPAAEQAPRPRVRVTRLLVPSPPTTVMADGVEVSGLSAEAVAIHQTELTPRRKGRRRCSLCRELGHRINTCPMPGARLVGG